MNRLLARLDGLPLYLLWGEKVGVVGCSAVWCEVERTPVGRVQVVVQARQAVDSGQMFGKLPGTARATSLLSGCVHLRPSLC